MFYFIPVSGVVDTVLDRDTFVNTQIASIETQIILLPEISYLNVYIIYIFICYYFPLEGSQIFSSSKIISFN